MSQFLPEGFDKKKGEKKSEDYLTPAERIFMQRFLGFPEDFPPKFKSWLLDYITVNITQIPASQIFGFSQQTFAAHSQVLPNDTATSTSYVNLANHGPEVTGMGKGTYICIFGCIFDSFAGGDGHMALSVNGSTPTDTESAFAWMSAAGRVNITRGTTLTFTEASNTVTAKYRVLSGTNTFRNRWLVIQRVGN